MSQETRQKSNREQVAHLLEKAAETLKEALDAVNTARELLPFLVSAEKMTSIAAILATARPVPGTRMLPIGIRQKADKAVATLNKLAQEIRAVPVTSQERVLAERRQT